MVMTAKLSQWPLKSSQLFNEWWMGHIKTPFLQFFKTVTKLHPYCMSLAFVSAWFCFIDIVWFVPIYMLQQAFYKKKYFTLGKKWVTPIPPSKKYIFLNLTFLKNLKSTSSRLVVQINEATALRTDLDCRNSDCDLSVCKWRSSQSIT